MNKRLPPAIVAALALLAAAALWAPVSGQQPQAGQAAGAPPPKQERPIFRGGASLVRVDVTVTNRQGDPVTDLTPADFVVSEDGYPQEIQTFELVHSTGAPDDDRSLEIRTPQHAAYEATREDVRLFLIFWDEYHIGEFIPALRGREMLTRFVTTAFAPTDLVGIMDQLTTVDSIRFTRDWRWLADRVHTLKGRFGVFFPARSPIEEAQLRMARDLGRVRNEITMSALKSAAAYLGNFREGRKAILFVSQGVMIAGRNGETQIFQDLVRAANANNTAIYTLDPGAEVGRMPGSLISLANATGGKAFVGSNSPGLQLPQMVKDASAFYLMGYVSNRDPADGKFHRINVRLKKSGYELRGRSGYFAPTRNAIEGARAAADASTLPPDIERALGDLDGGARRDRAVDMWIGMARGAEGRTRVTIAWSPKPANGAPVSSTPATVAMNVTGSQGTTYFDGSDNGARMISFEAPPGDAVVKASVRDARGQELDGELRRVSIPAFTGDRLSLGSAAVYRARSALDARAILEGRDLRPEVGREFEHTDRLFIRFPVYGANPGAPAAHLLNRQAARMRELPVTRLENGLYQIDMPLSPMARGDYLVSIEARQGDDAARVFVPLRIR